MVVGPVPGVRATPYQPRWPVIVELGTVRTAMPVPGAMASPVVGAAHGQDGAVGQGDRRGVPAAVAMEIAGQLLVSRTRLAVDVVRVDSGVAASHDPGGGPSVPPKVRSWSVS